MRALKLQVNHFRNLEDQEISFEDHAITLILGDNGHGKSSIIEALWLFCGAKSFRGASDGDMIRFGHDRAALKFLYDSEGINKSISINLIKGKRKEIFVGAEKLPRSADLLGEFVTVLFEPEHLSFVSGAPEKRRKTINISLCQSSRAYTATVSEYNRILNSRAALLKAGKSAEGERTLEVWDEGLARRGARVIAARGAYIKELEAAAMPIMENLSGGKEKISLHYDCPYYGAGYTENDIYENLLSALKRARERDWDAGVTSVGPHRDDLDIDLNGMAARRFASTGQKRSAVVALKLAECAVLKARLGVTPVFLLDDVLSELDEARRNFILDKIGEYQVIITDCYGALSLSDMGILRVVNGKAVP